MNRVQFSIAALVGALMPLVFDSALKGAALLAAAALCALVLWRASAAARHLVWLVAVVALLIVPVLSFALPQWRILPQWAASPLAGAAVTAVTVPPMTEGTQRTERTVLLPPPAASVPAISPPPLAEPAPQAPAVPIPHPASLVPDPVRTWRDWLPLAWAAGFAFFALRLLAAHLMLRRAARSCTPLTAPPDEFIACAFTVACAQLGIRRRVMLLLDEKRTIPVVWGVFRPRLLLPAEARAWNEEQLRSVLLHELAHIRRRDALVQWITQIACALHWFNPLVWLAAWRLHAERERACDDLVLASGVRPSAYAEHLLHVATKLSPARWTAACGLAMARKSSLEDRLLAVLSEKLNRRGVTHALAAIALLLGAAIAIPLAMLRAAESDKSKADAANVKAEPKDPVSKPLFENWKAGARTDGRIPGGRIGEMAASLKSYMDLNSGTEAAAKCEAVFKKCDAAHDWTPAGAAALLDEIEVAAPSRAEWAMRSIAERTIYPGKPLPDELANAPWGQPAANGLRIAWLLEPRAETQALDSVMKSRVLFHNTGKAPVCFATEDWIQNGGHKAKDANGKEISVWAIQHEGIRTRMIFRLAHGEYAEVEGHGLGVGSHETASETSIDKVGCWIEAKEGDAVSFTPGSVPVSFQTWINNEGLKNSVTVWQEMIAARVSREGPMPAAAADREQLLRRVMHDFPGTTPTAEELAAFIADNSLDALAKLTAGLQTRVATMPFAGELSGGETKFRVTAAGQKEEEPKSAAQLKPAKQTLPPGTEAQLDWGEAVNGLRGAVVVRTPNPGEPAAIYLAVQNVSEAAIRFADTTKAENLRKLYLSDSKGILMGLGSGEPTQTDVLLQPREVAFLAMFPPVKDPNKRSVEPALIEGLRKDSLQTWKVVLEIEKAPDGAWKGKLTTAETRGAVGTEGPQPKNKDAQALFKIWQDNARLNGDIPGGLLNRLHDKVQEFIRNNTGDASGDPYAKKMVPLELRFDSAGDWKPADVVALMDDIAAVTSIPLETTMEFLGQHTLQHGPPLPAALQKADWGEPLDGGLRMAFLLEPRAEEYHMGTEVKARILLHNSGNEPVAFVTSGFQQPGHSATLRDGGAKFTIDSTLWTTLGRPEAYRLAPGEYCEVYTPGLGIGARNKDHDDWSNVRAGSWILCSEGDDLVFTPGAVMLTSNETPADPGWWLKFITERLMRETPVPQDTREREYLLYRVVRDLFGTAPSTTQGEAFAADKSPDALKNLAVLLTKHPYGKQCHGPIRAGSTKFRVLPPDPDAAKKPRVAKNPGRYNIGDIVRLVVSQRAVGKRVVNDGNVTYYPPGKDNISHDLKLPDGYNSWAAGWAPSSTVLWVTQKGLLRKIDFTDPAKVEEARFEGDKTAGAPIPPDIRAALTTALDVPDEPKQVQEPSKLPPADLAPATPAPTQESKQPKQGASTEPGEKAADKKSADAPGSVQPITDGKSSAQVLRVVGQEPVVILTGRALTAWEDSTSRWGAVTMEVATSAKTVKIGYTWPEDAPGFLDLEVGGYPDSRFDLSRGRVFFVHFERMEFSADVFQVPATVKVSAITSPESLTQAAAAVTAWHAASDDRTLWECSRVVVPERDYKAGQPLDAAAEKIVWGEANDAGLRLGLGGLEPGASYSVGQQLPVKQYIRNDSTKAITFSPTQIFNEGVGGELVRMADGKKFPHRKGYPWQMFFDRVRLAPGHYIALGSGPTGTIMAEKDGSSTGGLDMMGHGFTVLPGDYSLQLTHDIGQFQGRPVNFHFGDPRGAPGLGEWTGVLKSAAVPLRLVDAQVKTARAGGSEAFGSRYMIAFDKGVIKLRHYNGYPNMALEGGPWEDQSRDWKIPAADGEYVAAWAVGGKGLWVKDASGITHLIVKENLTETGRWTLDQASGGLGGMPAGVRAALQLPPLTAAQVFDFKKLPATPGAAKIDGGFFEMTIAPGTVLGVPHNGGGFFVESGGSVYGPAEGNPVVELGLTGLLRARLAETPNTAGLEMLRHMIADGRGAIRDCGFRLLADLKAPQAPFDYDAVFHAMIRASIEDEDGPRELTPEAQMGYTWFHNLFHTTRREWERTRPLLAAGRYQPGEALGADPAIVWTPGPDGLSLGVSGLPAETNLDIEKSVPVAVYLQNDSNAPVKLSVPSEHNPGIQISLTDRAGNIRRAHYSFSAPLTGYSHHELAPGTGAKVAAFDLEACATPEEADRAEHKEGKPHNPRLAVPAGPYELHLEYRNYQENPVPKGDASEWTGKVTAKPVAVKIAAPGAALQESQKPKTGSIVSKFDDYMKKTAARQEERFPALLTGAQKAQACALLVKEGAKLNTTNLDGIWKGGDAKTGLSLRLEFNKPEKGKLTASLSIPTGGPGWHSMTGTYQRGILVMNVKQDDAGLELTPAKEDSPLSGRITVEKGGLVLTAPAFRMTDERFENVAPSTFSAPPGIPVEFPGGYQRVMEPKFTGEDMRIVLNPLAVIDRTMLESAWEGEKDGVKVVAKFGGTDAGRELQWRVSRDGKDIEATLGVEMEWDHDQARIVTDRPETRTATSAQYPAPALITAGVDGTLRMEIFPRTKYWHPDTPEYPVVKDLVLTRQADSANEPRKPGAKLPDEAYTRTGVHCQKFREEDAKRPGGKLMGNVSEARQGDGPLVPGLRMASDAKWNIGGTARVELVVRNAGSSDVKFAQTGRSDNGLSVVAIAKDGKEYEADIAQFRGRLVMNQLLLPPAHIVTVKSFTLRFDSDKRGVSLPGVAAFHLPPGDYTLRCKWNDARPDVGREGEWTGELVFADHKFTLLPVIPRRTPAELKEAEQKAQELSKKLKQGAKLTPPMLQGVWKGEDEKADYMLRLTFGVPSPGKVTAAIQVPWPKVHHFKYGNNPFGYVLTLEQDGDAVRFASCEEAGLPSDTAPTGDKRDGPVGGKISVGDGGALAFVMPAYILKDKCDKAPDGTESWSTIREFTGSDVSIPLHPLTILDQASLEGAWEGEKDGVTVRTRIAWNDGKPEMDWWSGRDGQVIKERMHLVLGSDCDRAAVQLEKDRHHPAPAGLYPGPDGTLRLTINQRTGSWQASVPEYPAVKDLVLTRREDGASSGTSRDPKDPARSTGDSRKPFSSSQTTNASAGFSTYSVNKGEETVFVIACYAECKATTSHSEDSKAGAWHEQTTLALKWFDQKKDVSLSYSSTSPDTLTLDGVAYDLKKGRVFKVNAYHVLKQSAVSVPPVTTKEDAAKLQQSLTDEYYDEQAQAILTEWQSFARADGKIPGALIGQLWERLRKEVPETSTWKEAREKVAVISCDPSRDYLPEEALAFARKVVAVGGITPGDHLSELRLFKDYNRRRGQPLPPELEKAAWGQPLPGGLRAGWLPAEPAEEYAAGSSISTRLFLHNAGKGPAAVYAMKRNIFSGCTVRDEAGQPVKTTDRRRDKGPRDTDLVSLGGAAWLLAPGEYVEVRGVSLGIGKETDSKNNTAHYIMMVIDAVPGQELTVALEPLNLIFAQGSSGPLPWKDIVEKRLSRESPLPASAADRTLLLQRVTRDLFAEAPTVAEVAAFVEDESPQALSHLAARIIAKPHVEPYFGNLLTGGLKLRVTNKPEKTSSVTAPRAAAENPASAKPAYDDAAKKPQSRKIDWSKFPSYDKLTNPFDPEEATRLAAAPKRSTDDTRRLMFMILQAAAEKRTDLKHLLKDEELKKSDDKYHSLALALAAYDYSVNGNKTALQYILDELAKERIGSDAQAAVPLGFIDEWDLTMSAHEKHFAHTDGAGALASMIFWQRRQYLYPESYTRFHKVRMAAAKLDAESLQGVWKGSKDGVNVELRLGDHQGWEVRQGDKLIKADLTTHALATGKAVTLMAPGLPCGRLSRGDDGTLRLSLWPDTSETTAYPRVSDIVLEKQVGDAAPKTAGTGAFDTPVSNDIAPKNKYARTHFTQWQKYARANGDIPGGLIATLDRSITFTGDPKIKEWRKRLDATRDWPAREAAAFLDEVAATGNWDDDEGVLAVVENCDVTQSGKPLPPELASLAWGNAGESFQGARTSGDLRVAFTLEPSAASYAQGTQLPVTVHYHNAGPAPLVFPLGMRTMDMAEAKDEQGLMVFAHWTNPGMQNSDRRHSVRLEPGHWIAVSGALLTLAPGHYAETPDSYGNVMLTRPGTTVRLRWLACTTTWAEGNGGQIPWKDIVAGSIGRFSPMPKSRADRESLIRRVTFGLTGQEATAADVAGFAADDSPEALTKLTARLQSLSLPVRFAGWLRTGEQTFKVTPAATEYRGTVMTATDSGMYEVDGPLIMRHSGDGGSFEFVPSLPTPHPPLVFAVKDAGNRRIPHGIVWRHGSRIVWVAEIRRVRKLDLTVPGKLTETELPAGLDSVPEDLRAALVKAFPAVETAKAQDAPPALEKPEPPASAGR